MIPDQEESLAATTAYSSEKVAEPDYFSNYDDTFENYFLMQAPWAVVAIVVFYLYFVLKLGPDLMANRKAYDLRRIIQFYNFVQVIFSFWWFCTTMNIMLVNSETMSISSAMCRPYIIPKEQQQPMNFMAWLYLMSKYVELLDTVFFVLRKKQNQVTFLHVYHHTNMALSTWFFIKYVRASQSSVLGICNTFVHTVMYGYYLLATLGPSIQKYLWWKKYITRMQIGQFLVVLVYLVILMYNDCSIPNSLMIFAIFNTASFLILFSQFYVNSYKKTNQDKQEKQTNVINNNNDNKDPKKEVEFIANNNNVSLTSADHKKQL
ncbi:hypothetical protein O3M35_002146 [Rhynocoris fuscipes]|uniref:Elongation of very long chain fatty acids protein n=1 Tax=Rhynocoris fuscipes TaxID=488301 RepID=A0AAW1CTB6_9HEMI